MTHGSGQVHPLDLQWVAIRTASIWRRPAFCLELRRSASVRISDRKSGMFSVHPSGCEPLACGSGGQATPAWVRVASVRKALEVLVLGQGQSPGVAGNCTG